MGFNGCPAIGPHESIVVHRGFIGPRQPEHPKYTASVGRDYFLTTRAGWWGEQKTRDRKVAKHGNFSARGLETGNIL